MKIKTENLAEENLFLTVEGTLPVHRSMNKLELKQFYGISYPTLKKWLSPIADKLNYDQRRMFFSMDLRLIRELLDGVPFNAPSDRSNDRKSA